MKRMFLILLVTLLCVASANAASVTASAGTATVNTEINGQFLHYLVVDWTSTSGGAVTATISGLEGMLLAFMSDPVASASPTDNYDIDITDVAGYEILGGSGEDRDNVNAEKIAPLILGQGSTWVPQPIVGNLTLSITNAGNAKQGTIYLYVEQRRRQ